MLSSAPTEASNVCAQGYLPCSAADEHDVPLLRQLVFLRGHRSITRPVEQFLEQVLHQAGRRRKTQHRLTTHRSPLETSTSELAWRSVEYCIWPLNTVHGITAEKEDQVISSLSLCTRQDTDVRARSKKGLYLPNISRLDRSNYFRGSNGNLSVSATPVERSSKNVAEYLEVGRVVTPVEAWPGLVVEGAHSANFLRG